LSQALQGSMAGVTVTRNNNAPGASSTIRVRGITTIGDSNPLIIVDGVPVDNINWVNPSDVESISVLKDAASASIYGSRAAAGVILITTKRARTGQLSLEFTTEYGFETPTAMPEYVDVTRYMQMKNELRWNDNGNDANEFPRFPSDLVNNYMSLNAENPDRYPNTDWVDLILNDYAPRQSHNLRVSAGTEAIRSTFSLAYDKTDALYMDRTYERLSTRFNNNVIINNFISANLDMHYRRSISQQPSVNPIY
jgi:TonB-dependent SusC/RagA subfamily outer membrane receptor